MNLSSKKNQRSSKLNTTVEIEKVLNLYGMYCMGKWIKADGFTTTFQASPGQNIDVVFSNGNYQIRFPDGKKKEFILFEELVKYLKEKEFKSLVKGLQKKNG